QHMGERSALDLASGKLCRIFVAMKAELLQHMTRLVGVVTRAEPRLDIGQRRVVSGEVGLLREVTDGRAGLDETRAAVRFDEAGHDLEQCRFARPVAPDQAYAFGLRNRKFDTIQQWRSTEGETDVAELDKGR